MESREIKLRTKRKGYVMLRRSVLIIAEKLKPILLKFLPRPLLQKMKQNMLVGMFAKLSEYQVLTYDKSRFAEGINLIGNIKADTGLGQSCRLVANLINEARIPLSIYLYSSDAGATTQVTKWEKYISKALPYGVNLVHLNPNELGMAFVNLDRSVWEHHYNIAFWLWELEEFPDEWVPCMNLFHEIWTPSEFISKTIRKKTSIPVRTLPYHVTVQANRKWDRHYFGLPEDKFLYLTMYDSGSVAERKNPMGVIDAYKKAFPKENSSVGLVVKMKSSSAEEERKVRKALSGYENIYFIQEVLTKEQVDSLISCVDVLVSLHRAEGFGLPIAEAMLLGTAVIATNWSANTEFMNEQVSCMVGYSRKELEQDIGPYKKGQFWAEPDLEQAVTYMKRLYVDREFYEERIELGKRYVQNKLGKEPMIALLHEHLKELGE